jgi:hypothetical protein
MLQDLQKQITFFVKLAISCLLIESVCELFLRGSIGDVVSISEKMIIGFVILLFVVYKYKRLLIHAIRREFERRLAPRVTCIRQARTTLLACNIDLLAYIVNRGANGLGLVLPDHVKKYVKKGVMVSIGTELYRVVWAHSKGQQYQIGLQRSC